MKLLLDIGNSRLKWGLVADEDRFQSSGAMPVNEEMLPYFFEDMLRNNPIDRVAAANVVGPHYEKIITDWWLENSSANVNFITTPSSFDGLSVCYEDPNTFGVDRFLAMLAARNLTNSHFCSIDCGTAITLDVVDNTGKHLGGHILPGLRLFPTLLTDNTLGCDIKKQSEQYHFDLASNTQDAMQNAALTAIVAYLNQMTQSINQQFAQQVDFFLTGGDAKIMKPHLHRDINFQPTLVLQGINCFLVSS